MREEFHEAFWAILDSPIELVKAAMAERAIINDKEALSEVITYALDIGKKYPDERQAIAQWILFKPASVCRELVEKSVSAFNGLYKIASNIKHWIHPMENARILASLQASIPDGKVASISKVTNSFQIKRTIISAFINDTSYLILQETQPTQVAANFLKSLVKSYEESPKFEFDQDREDIDF